MKIQHKNENTKPLYYCPFHKTKEIFIYFNEDEIFKCNIKDCFCNNINGWLSSCSKCGKVIHNCIHGCETGICIISKNNKDINNPKNQEKLYFHYLEHHRSNPVYLYYDS